MLKVLKVKFEDGNQTLDVPRDCEIVANLYADLNGTVLLIRMPDESVSVTPEVVSSPPETSLEA